MRELSALQLERAKRDVTVAEAMGELAATHLSSIMLAIHRHGYEISFSKSGKPVVSNKSKGKFLVFSRPL